MLNKKYITMVCDGWGYISWEWNDKVLNVALTVIAINCIILIAELRILFVFLPWPRWTHSNQKLNFFYMNRKTIHEGERKLFKIIL